MNKTMLPMLLVLVGVAVLAVALYVVLSRTEAGGFDHGHTQRTLATGTSAKAQVISVRDRTGRLNSNPSIEFELEVQPPSGTPFKASARAIISVVDLPRFQPGATIDVRYDAADLRSVAIVP